MSGVGVAIVAGKGGVGSSTVAAALAVAAAADGADVLFIAVDGRPGMGRLIAGTPNVRDLDGDEQVLQASRRGRGRIRGRTIPGAQAFGDYLELRGVGGLLRRAAASASLPMIAAATPGLEHLLVLGKIKELDRDRAADLIIVDAPPAGHATTFLRSATTLADVVASGPVRDQAVEVRAMLTDAERCAVMIVTLPEETPVTEAIELATDLADLDMHRLPTVVNACWPDRAGLAKSPTAAARASGVTLTREAKAALDASWRYGRLRLDQQRDQIDRLTGSLPGPTIELPRLPTPRLDRAGLDELAAALVVDGLPSRAVT
jgi:anion-transporting  ArsA/GET3 family ATPase